MEGINKNLFSEKFEDIKKYDFCLMKTERDYLLRLKIIFGFLFIVFGIFGFLPELYSHIFINDPRIFYKMITFILTILFVGLSIFIISIFLEKQGLYISKKYLINIGKKHIIENNNIEKIRLYSICKNHGKSLNINYYIEIIQKSDIIAKYKISISEYTVIPYLFKEFFPNIEIADEGKQLNNFQIRENELAEMLINVFKKNYLKLKNKFGVIISIEKYIKYVFSLVLTNKFLLEKYSLFTDKNSFYVTLKEKYYKNGSWIFN